MSTKFRTAYDDEQSLLSNASSLDFAGEVSLAQQHMADDCDINNILSRYNKTGILEHVNEAVSSYGDFTDVQDFQTALHRVVEAEAAFMALPAAVRDRFANDPAQLVSFVNEEKNRDEAVKLGLLKDKEPAPIKDTPPGKGDGAQKAETPPERL